VPGDKDGEDDDDDTPVEAPAEFVKVLSAELRLIGEKTRAGIAETASPEARAGDS
jgi:hypothetical protein